VQKFWIKRRRDPWSAEVGLAYREAESASQAVLEFLAEQEFGQHDAFLKALAALDISEGQSGIARARYGSCEFLAEPTDEPDARAA
jgi:hypothetical protein